MAANEQLELINRIWLETEGGPVPGAGRVEGYKNKMLLLSVLFFN